MKKLLGSSVQVLLILLTVVGIYLRFYRTDWSQGTNLHPDEYGLTNTLVQLQIPKTISGYFNTRESPLSPYTKYDQSGLAIANGPDNGMRWGQWPQILIRFAAEASGATGYNEIRLLGRKLSALADAFSVLMIFLIGSWLYTRKVGLLAACLSSLAVMQIQQSHFMTVDNFATFFAMIAFYACVRIAQRSGLPQATTGSRPLEGPPKDQPVLALLGWHLLFGVALGMALASKINLLPLAGMVVLAGFIRLTDLKLKSWGDVQRIFPAWFLLSCAAALMSLLTFRLTQQMSFRNPTGDTAFFTLHLNPDWIRNMQWAQMENNGVNAGPPGEQWAHRAAILFPWTNIVLWGMGLPLGLMSWLGFAWSAWRIIRRQGTWEAHLLTLAWTGGYFLFMGTRWVKSIRYFLPIYPFLALLAAWGLVELWQQAEKRPPVMKEQMESIRRRINPSVIIPSLTSALVVLGSLIWAVAFVQAVYQQDHTRIQATRWIFDHIPGPFHLTLVDAGGNFSNVPIEAPDGVRISSQQPFIRIFRLIADGSLDKVTIPHLLLQSGSGILKVTIAADPEGHIILDEAVVNANSTSVPGDEVQANFQGASLKGGSLYYLIASPEGDRAAFTLFRSVISNETWDEGLPFPFDGINPFGQLYKGIQMEVRQVDDENKREMFINTLSQADYIILPSQRSIWSTCRIPRTYPMTMEYYRALFDGRLGFDLVATFSAPIRLGALEISDVGGTLAWNTTPLLPLFNHSLLAAEEAFSVYDHPPVWIFKKRLDYNPIAVAQFLRSIDLSQVVIEGPRQASLPPCQ